MTKPREPLPLTSDRIPTNLVVRLTFLISSNIILLIRLTFRRRRSNSHQGEDPGSGSAEARPVA